MATLGASVLTLHDHAKRLDPKGKTAIVTEVLSQDNEMLDNMLWKEGNLITGEQTTIRTGLPTVYWRLLNQGTPKSKSTTAQITENTAILSARSEIDEDIVALNGNSQSFRLSESFSFVEGMGQEMAQTLIYGSGANPEEFIGFANRYNDTSAANGQNILDAGGTGSDNSSIWLVGWGPRTVFGVFPKGSKAGLEHKDLGIGDAFDSNNDRFQAWMDQYKWKGGLVVKDWRYAVRIANIDISDLLALTGTQAVTASTSIIKLMSRARDRFPSMSGITPSFYANRTVLSNLRIAALDKAVSVLAIEKGLNQFGQSISTTTFDGIPIKMMDQLTEAETQIT